MKHVFIVNPVSGKADASLYLVPRLIDAAAGAGVDYAVELTQHAGHAAEIARQYGDDGEPVRLYACGGDGTLNEVINGAVGFPQASVGCYPCGSGNDFVKYYGGKQHFLNLQAQINAVEHSIDLIRVGNRYAVNAAHFGFDSCVAKTMMNIRRKKLIGGKNAYTTAVLVALFRGMKNRCRVTVDGKLLNPSEKLLLCTVANGQYVGGSFCCAPRSKSDDGLIDVCLIRPISRLRFVKILKPYTNGEHLDREDMKDIVIYRQAKKVEVTAAPGFAYSLDGEIIYSEHFTVEIAEKALDFAVPED